MITEDMSKDLSALKAEAKAKAAAKRKADGLKAKYKYAEKNVIRYPGLALNIKTDADLIELLSKVSNRQGFIKSAIREFVDNHEQDMDKWF